MHVPPLVASPGTTEAAVSSSTNFVQPLGSQVAWPAGRMAAALRRRGRSPSRRDRCTSADRAGTASTAAADAAGPAPAPRPRPRSSAGAGVAGTTTPGVIPGLVPAALATCGRRSGGTVGPDRVWAGAVAMGGLGRAATPGAKLRAPAAAGTGRTGVCSSLATGRPVARGPAAGRAAPGDRQDGRRRPGWCPTRHWPAARCLRRRPSRAGLSWMVPARPPRAAAGPRAGSGWTRRPGAPPRSGPWAGGRSRMTSGRRVTVRSSSGRASASNSSRVTRASCSSSGTGTVADVGPGQHLLGRADVLDQVPAVPPVGRRRRLLQPLPGSGIWPAVLVGDVLQQRGVEVDPADVVQAGARRAPGSRPAVGVTTLASNVPPPKS